MNIPPIMLKLRARELLNPGEDDPRQVVEVLHGEKVLGQLPVTRAVYEMLPHDLGTLTVTVIAQRAEVEGHA